MSIQPSSDSEEFNLTLDGQTTRQLHARNSLPRHEGSRSLPAASLVSVRTPKAIDNKVTSLAKAPRAN